MKKVMLMVALVFGLVVLSAESYGQAIKYYSTEVMDEINATDEQRAAVKELVARYDAQFKALKADKSLSKEDSEAQRKKLIGDRAKEYWKILNPEQTKYLKDKAKAIKEANKK